MRVDEGREGWTILATKTKARTAAVERGKKSLLNDPGSELQLQPQLQLQLQQYLVPVCSREKKTMDCMSNNKYRLRLINVLKRSVGPHSAKPTVQRRSLLLRRIQ